MKFVRFNILILLLCLVRTLQAQPGTTVLEMTRGDITQYPQVPAQQVSIFSLQLGMSRADAQKLMDYDSRLSYRIDNQHTTGDIRIYVYDKDASGGKGNTILYLIWKDGNPKLTHITFFPEMVPYLCGASAKLLSVEALDPKSKLVPRFLGAPVKSEVTLDVPSIQVKHTTYSYANGFQLTLREDGADRSVVLGLEYVP